MRYILFLLISLCLLSCNSKNKESHVITLGGTLTSSKIIDRDSVHPKFLEIGYPPVKIKNLYWGAQEEVQIGTRAPILVRIMQELYPMYSRCEKCGRPWNCCQSHSINMGGGNGLFATCDVCWYESSTDERKELYLKCYTKYWDHDASISLKKIMDTIAAQPEGIIPVGIYH